MKRHELISHLTRQGCQVEREGARHTIYRNPTNEVNVPVPRHNEIDNRLARTICKQLGIPPMRGS